MSEDFMKPCEVMTSNDPIATVKEIADDFDCEDMKSDPLLTAQQIDSEEEKKMPTNHVIKSDFNQEISHSKPDVSQQMVTKSKVDPYESLSIAIEALINCEFIMELIEAAEVMHLKNSALEQIKSAKDVLTTLLHDMNNSNNADDYQNFSDKVGAFVDGNVANISKKEEDSDGKEMNINSFLDSVKIEEFSIKEESSYFSDSEYQQEHTPSKRTNLGRRASVKPKRYYDYDDGDMMLEEEKVKMEAEDHMDYQTAPAKKKKGKPKGKKKKIKNEDGTEKTTLKGDKTMADKDDLFPSEKLIKMLCTHCNKKLAYQAKNMEEAAQKLDQHIQRVHFNRFPCYICNDPEAVFSSSLALRKHRWQKHHSKQIMVCPICAKTFGSNYYSRHLLRHKGEKKHQCKTCDEKFFTVFLLREHERKHTGERPFSCETCGKSFKKQSHIYRHKIIHTGKKPYVCKLCDKGFNQSYNLTVHMRSHASGQLPVTNYTSDETVPKDEDFV